MQQANTNSTRKDDEQENVKHVALLSASLSVHLHSPPIPNLLPWLQPMAQALGWLAAMEGVKQVHCWRLDGGGDACGSEVDWGTGGDNGELMC